MDSAATGGVTAVAGVALMFTGVGGPAGLALMAASDGLLGEGISVIAQKATTGVVNWWEAGRQTLVASIGVTNEYAII